MNQTAIKPYLIEKNTHFIGRTFEREQLARINKIQGAQIIIVYGRRRVGKTELIEQMFRDRKLLKFEGIEGQEQTAQRAYVTQQLAKYTGDQMLNQWQPRNWIDVFEQIGQHIKRGEYTLYFEELQWLADYQNEFIAEFKYVWDNLFRHNPQLRVILCGSSPSFMINHVMHSKALYNRSQHEMYLQPLSISDAAAILPKRSKRDIMDAYLTLGGIPEYLKRLQLDSSIFLGICRQSFMAQSYFSREYKRIFISSMAENIHYETSLEFLARRRYATRTEIANYLKIKAGGNLTALLKDLELCGFIHGYTPYHLSENSKLKRYAINDNYLMFYFKFIKPQSEAIIQGQYNQQPTLALKQDTHYKWLGFAFERYCRANNVKLAALLGFSAIQYKSGAYFSKASTVQAHGVQIDLIFHRADKVLTICEVRYLQSKVNVSVIEEFERKLDLLPNPKNYTIEKVLISAQGATDELINRYYFDRILTLDDLMS